MAQPPVTPLVTLRFYAGTIEVHGALPPEAPLSLGDLPGCVEDTRAGCARAPAYRYADIVLSLRGHKIEYVDEARRYAELAGGAKVHKEPRPFQVESLAAWKKAKGRGVVVLPTGAGKTHVATMAIDDKRRATLVVAPTLDLVRQWTALLSSTFGVPVGVVGGGEHTVEHLTVTTYDSAWAHMEHLGARFGFVVFDEVHHLCAESYAFAARLCLAPYRLGLTATPERSDGRDAILDELVGPIVYRKEIDELEGTYLSDYETVRIDVELSDEARLEHDEARAVYKKYLVESGVRLGGPGGWSAFIQHASRSVEGRRALAAYRRQRAIAFAAPQKLDHVELLLREHAGQRTLLFTDDNATAYAIARKFLVPVITHQTKVRERTALLDGFAQGTLPVLATSRVLNEGIDVPDAQVAIIVSGTGSVREHVQRLGRILRRREGKRAVLYELVTANTAEGFTSERRREHVAYR